MQMFLQQADHYGLLDKNDQDAIGEDGGPRDPGDQRHFAPVDPATDPACDQQECEGS